MGMRPRLEEQIGLSKMTEDELIKAFFMPHGILENISFWLFRQLVRLIPLEALEVKENAKLRVLIVTLRALREKKGQIMETLRSLEKAK